MWKPNYADIAELKEYVRITDTVDDDLMTSCVSSASRMIDRAARRQFGVVDTLTTRRYDIGEKWCTGNRFVEIDDIGDPTDFAVLNNGITISDECILYPLNAVVDNGVYTELSVPGNYTGVLECEGLWGWNAVPAAIHQATLITASRLYTRRDAPFGILGGSQNGESMYIAKIDPDVEALIRPYYRWW